MSPLACESVSLTRFGIFPITSDYFLINNLRPLACIGLKSLPPGLQARAHFRGVSMLRKCANPACPNSFLDLSQGKLFHVEREDFHAPISRPAAPNRKIRSPRRVEHYWLCDECSPLLTLTFENGRGIITVPIPAEMRNTIPLHFGRVRPAIEQMQLPGESRCAMKGAI